MPRIPNAERMGWSSFRIDMFGRTKVSEPFTLFDSQHRYKDSGDFNDETSGTATVSHLPNESTALLTIGTASGDRIARESRKVFPYQPGKSLQVMQTFVFASPKAGLRQRAGYFSRQNGVYLEQDGLDAYIVIRSFVTGEIVNTRIPQSEWNVDQLDGTGPTDLVLDLTKTQIFITEYEWLGAGSVRVGFMINGVFVTAHQFNHANNTSTVYMTTATLPVRYEIENIAGTSSSSSLKEISVSIISNGGDFLGNNIYTINRETASVDDDYFPLISLRMKSGRTDSVIVPELVNILPKSSNRFDWALIQNPTITGGEWTTHEEKGNVEYNVSATAMSGGTTLLEGIFGGDNQAPMLVDYGDTMNFYLQLGRSNSSTPVSDVLTLAVKVPSEETGSAEASFSWFDLT
jgi:hypothetical protein